jgi:hypothetical protein
MAADNKTCQLLFIFIEKQEVEYMIIEKAMIKHIQKISRA